MESSPSSSSPSTVIDLQGKRKLLTSISINPLERPSDNKRKKMSSNNENEAILLDMNSTPKGKTDVLQAIRKNFLAINPSPSTHPPSQSQSRRIKSKISPSTRSAFRYVKSKKEIDSDDDVDTDQLKDEELKKTLKEEKRQRKKKGQLLDQLQENYKDLLEKYAQAENTIDQLRFQPKLSENNTPTNHSSETGQPSKIELSTIKYPSVNETPLSSIRRIVSSSTTTTSVMKSVSPGHSIEDDETAIEEDLLNQSRTCGGKMKTFLTLMDANQLSLAEQKQCYQTIKQDYERLLQALNEHATKNENNQRTDLNEELTNMKQLLKDIVKQITEDLLEKSLNSSRSERQVRSPPPPTPPSQLSVRSSLCNPDELMNQYQKILTAVNTGPTHSISSQSSQSLPPPPLATTEKSKAYVYVSADSSSSDRTTPTPFSRAFDSISHELETVGERSTDGMIRVMIHHQPLVIGTTKFNRNHCQTMNEEFISNVSFHSSSARSSSESLTSPRLVYRQSSMETRRRRRGYPINESEQIHRSTHTWRPQNLHPIKKPIYRSSLYIEPKRVMVIPRYTTITRNRTTMRMDVDDPGYESEAKSRYSSRDLSSSSSSDSDLDICLNEVYARAEQIECESNHLAKSIRRMLKLMMTTMK